MSTYTKEYGTQRGENEWKNLTKVDKQLIVIEYKEWRGKTDKFYD